MSSAGRILVVDDDVFLLRYLRAALESALYQVETVSSGEAAVQRAEEDDFPPLVLLDVNMGGIDGLETLQHIHRLQPRSKVIMLSGITDTRRIAGALRAGAAGFLSKPFEADQFAAVVEELARPHPPAESHQLPPEDVIEVGGDFPFVTASAALRQVRDQAAVVAAVDVPVLILGESGTGKEEISRFIHSHSKRARGPFLKLNCAAMPAALLESELFGYEPGAFTGAVGAKPGKFELCHGGTMLLDEIGEMPLELQSKLLQVLQDGTLMRLGGRSTKRMNARILAATNIDVVAAMKAGEFRQDLYFRLSVMTLQVPPLRAQREAIPALLRHFVACFAERYGVAPLPVSARLLEVCSTYPWPGNIREMQSLVKRYLVFGNEDLALEPLLDLGVGNAAGA